MAKNGTNRHWTLRRAVVRAAAVAAFLLLIPVLGNLFVKGWNWPLSSFLVAVAILFGGALLFELAWRRKESFAYRMAAGLALTAALALVWVNGAVEIIGDDNPANLMFFGVPLVGLAGAVRARFQPRGMTRALLATAIAQALVPVIALVARSPREASWSPGVLPVFGLNTVFVALFAGSALLFRSAGRRLDETADAGT